MSIIPADVQFSIPDTAWWLLAVNLVLLFAGLIALFIRLLRHLGAFAQALESHARLNSNLNDELAKAIAQRQALQEKHDGLEANHRQLKDDNSRLASRVNQLEQDKINLNKQIEDLRTLLDLRDNDHREVVSALTAQLASVKSDLETERKKRQELEGKLADEKRERERVEREMRAEVERLTEANAKLVEENQALRLEVNAIRSRSGDGLTEVVATGTSDDAGTGPAEKPNEKE